MASTYSTTLRLELIGNGDQSGTWGDTTNINLGTLLEAAITGVQAITFADANYTLTSFNGLPDEARNAVLVLSGTNTATRQLIAPSVEKTYTVVNGTGASVTIKTSGGTGVTIPNGATQFVYCNGSEFYQVTSPYYGTTTGTGGAVYAVSPTFTGTPLAPTAANGTNTTQIATTAFVNAAVTTATGSLGTMSTQNASNVAITGGAISNVSLANLTSALAVVSGGTGANTISAEAVVIGNGTSAVKTVAPGSSNNVLLSNGTAWTSAALPVLGIGQTWTDVTGSRAFGSSYTNSTSRPIQLAIRTNQPPGGSYLTGTVGGVSGIPMGSGYSAGGGYTGFGTLIVPAGSTYQVDVNNISGGASLAAWFELR